MFDSHSLSIELPQSIGKLVKLRKLLLAGNQLSFLPETMKNCRELELVRLSSNRLTALPPWLLRLPKLSWIAFAGNQLNYSPRPSDLRVPSIRWQDLEVQNKLGEGASGSVYQIQLTSSYENIPSGLYGKIQLDAAYVYLAYFNIGFIPFQTALKEFKGEVTSDGLAEDEILVSGP